MNNHHIQKSESSEFSPKAKYYQAQINRLNDIEGKHDREPDKPAAFIAVGLSVIEAGVAFFLLLPAGPLIASGGAMFPVLLLWGMANFQAERVELARKYDELVEQYDESV
jgi:hypothetical protein